VRPVRPSRPSVTCTRRRTGTFDQLHPAPVGTRRNYT